MKQKTSWQRIIGAALMLVMLGTSLPNPAFAQIALPPGAIAAGQAQLDACTNFKERKAAVFSGTSNGADQNPGLLSEIYTYIKEIVNQATENLFNAFVNSTAYRNAVAAAVTLSVVIFGAAFTMGVVQASFGQVLVRMVKIGIIFTLLSPSGWEFFNGTMVHFFTDGTDELVKGVVAIGTNTDPSTLPADATPFFQFDKLAEFIIHPETIVAILGSMADKGPFGLMMGGFMAIASVGFVMLVVDALKLYAVTFVARTLLLGLGPVFFCFLLFEKTKNLFMAWLNALITLALQPILLFTFLSFFLILIETAGKDMFNAELCWSEFSSSEGTDIRKSFWRFVNPDTGATINSAVSWNGAFECLAQGSQGGSTAECPEFPINVVDILSFLILVYLAQRFSKQIEKIATELGGAYIQLDTGGRLAQFTNALGEKGADGKTRAGPGSSIANRQR